MSVIEGYLEDNRPTIDEICDSYDECHKECPVYELCHQKDRATTKWNEYKFPTSTPRECGTYFVKYEDGSTGDDDCIYYGYSGTYQFDSNKVVAWADKEGDSNE